MTKKNTPSESLRDPVPSLDSRYGEIGIAAVAAALRFQSQGTKPAHETAEPKEERWLPDLAA